MCPARREEPASTNHAITQNNVAFAPAALPCTHLARDSRVEGQNHTVKYALGGGGGHSRDFHDSSCAS